MLSLTRPNFGARLWVASMQRVPQCDSMEDPCRVVLFCCTWCYTVGARFSPCLGAGDVDVWIRPFVVGRRARLFNAGNSKCFHLRDRILVLVYWVASMQRVPQYDSMDGPCRVVLFCCTWCWAVRMLEYNKHNIKSKFPPKEPHQIVQYNKSFKLKPSMGYS